VESSPDATLDAAPARCDPTKPFGAPVALDALNTSSTEDGASLSPDERTIYFGSDRPGGTGKSDLYVATRASRDDFFGGPVAIAGVNTAGNETWPSVTGNGLILYAGTDGTPFDIAVATRSSTGASFGALAPVAALDNSAPAQGLGLEDPYILEDGSAIYFDNRADLYRAAHNAGGSFDAPVLVPGASINTSAAEQTVVVSPDELTLYFGSNRTGGMGMFDIYVATRGTTSDAFGTPTELAALGSAANEWPTWISPDGCVLYFESDRAGSSDLFFATRGM
jgi:Tol biopolymer transport system component